MKRMPRVTTLSGYYAFVAKNDAVVSADLHFSVDGKEIASIRVEVEADADRDKDQDSARIGGKPQPHKQPVADRGAEESDPVVDAGVWAGASLQDRRVR